MTELATTTYKKLNSFESTRIINKRSSVKEQLSRALNTLQNQSNFKKSISSIPSNLVN